MEYKIVIGHFPSNSAPLFNSIAVLAATNPAIALLI
jgi:hypothetical protein